MCVCRTTTCLTTGWWSPFTPSMTSTISRQVLHHVNSRRMRDTVLYGMQCFLIKICIDSVYCVKSSNWPFNYCTIHLTSKQQRDPRNATQYSCPYACTSYVFCLLGSEPFQNIMCPTVGLRFEDDKKVLHFYLFRNSFEDGGFLEFFDNRFRRPVMSKS